MTVPIQIRRHCLILAFGIFLFLHTRRNVPRDQSTTPQAEPFVQPGAAKTIYKPGDSIPLPNFIATAVKHARTPSTTTTTPPPLTETYKEHIWSEPDTPEQRLLSASRDLLHSPLLSRLLVAPRIGAVFCPLPGVIHEALITHLTAIEAGPLVPLAAYAPRDRERFLMRDSVLRYAFVRHPFARALAVYRAGTIGDLDAPGYREFMGHVRGNQLSSGEHEMQRLSFSFFLTFLGRQNAVELHETFRSQSRLCGIGQGSLSIPYTFLGRYETVTRDLKTVEQRLGVHGAPLPSAASDRNVSNVFQSSRLRAKAIRLWTDDLHNFHYSATVSP